MKNNELLDMISGSTDGVFAIGADNKIVFWNETAQEILGFKSKDVIGKSYNEIVPATDLNGNSVCLGKYAHKKEIDADTEVQNCEIITHSAKANRIWLNLTVFIVPSTQDEYGMSVFVFRDITRQKIYEKIISEVISKTELANQFSDAMPATREREILLLLADGHTTKSISSKLYIALSTLRKHIRNIYSKLQAHSMVEALAIARKSNLI